MLDKYKYEDEITNIIMKDLYNINIKYISHIDMTSFYNVDNRWNKIFSLFYSKENEYVYIDHDVILNPELINTKKINFTKESYKYKTSACIIDSKILSDYFNVFFNSPYKFIKNIDYEEKILTKVIYKNKNLNEIFLPFNKIKNNSLIIHYNTLIINRFILKNKDKLPYKYLFKLTKKLEELYEQ